MTINLTVLNDIAEILAIIFIGILVFENKKLKYLNYKLVFESYFCRKNPIVREGSAEEFFSILCVEHSDHYRLLFSKNGTAYSGGIIKRSKEGDIKKDYQLITETISAMLSQESKELK